MITVTQYTLYQFTRPQRTVVPSNPSHQSPTLWLCGAWFSDQPCPVSFPQGFQFSVPRILFPSCSYSSNRSDNPPLLGGCRPPLFNLFPPRLSVVTPLFCSSCDPFVFERFHTFFPTYFLPHEIAFSSLHNGRCRSIIEHNLCDRGFSWTDRTRISNFLPLLKRACEISPSSLACVYVFTPLFCPSFRKLSSPYSFGLLLSLYSAGSHLLLWAQRNGIHTKETLINPW